MKLLNLYFIIFVQRNTHFSLRLYSQNEFKVTSSFGRQIFTYLAFFQLYNCIDRKSSCLYEIDFILSYV